jgi:hypothetical protein
MAKHYTIHIPKGSELTLTADASSSGSYVRLTQGGVRYSPIAVAASSTAVVGPFNEERDYDIVSDLGEITRSQVCSGIYTKVDEDNLAFDGDMTLTGTFDITHVATQDDDHALELIVDAAGYGDVKALDIDYITGAIPAADDEGIILINIDETMSVGGEVFGLEVLSTKEGGAKIIALKTGVGIHPLEQFKGSFAALDTILNKAVDVTTELATVGGGSASLFVADNDTITLGSSAKFEEVEVILSTVASGTVGIAATFEFSTGVDTWTTFVPTDGTNSFKNTGVILWDDANIPTWATGTGSEYLIRITRTRNNVTTTPIATLIKAAAGTIFGWDENANVTMETLEVDTMPAYDDDTAAGVGGLTAGQTYQTTGSGAAPLNAAGIVMIKQ